MLHELSPSLEPSKAQDILARLEKKKVDQALPAEAELSLLWALSRLGEIDAEPYWWGDQSRPDAYTESLLVGRPAAIEITAINDNRMAGQGAMNSVAVAISEFANKVGQGAGKFLYFRFREEHGYREGRYFRHRLAPETYKLSDRAKSLIQAWFKSGRSVREQLRIVEPGLDVHIERTKHKQIPFHNFWSSMPAETHSLEDNPIYEALGRKLGQLRAAPEDCARMIFVMDVGSMLLNRLGQFNERMPTGQAVSASQILQHFVRVNSAKLESVVVFVPRRADRIRNSKAMWDFFIADRPGWTTPPEAIARLVSELPLPRFDGYQARSLLLQGAFSPQRHGWYLGVRINSLMKEHRMRISARALLDLLAGRITAEQFRHFNGQRPGEVNLFRHWLDMGWTVSNIEFESAGVDQDDDWVVVTFNEDPAARPLKLPSESAPDSD